MPKTNKPGGRNAVKAAVERGKAMSSAQRGNSKRARRERIMKWARAKTERIVK
jgi:hypothetical protein